MHAGISGLGYAWIEFEVATETANSVNHEMHSTFISGVDLNATLIGRNASVIWLIGSIVMIGRLGPTMRHMQRLQLSVINSEDRRIRRLLQQASHQVKITPPPVMQIRVNVGPMVIGIANPRIILPSAKIPQFSSDQILAILIHEREHIRRKDNL